MKRNAGDGPRRVGASWPAKILFEVAEIWAERARNEQTAIRSHAAKPKSQLSALRVVLLANGVGETCAATFALSIILGGVLLAVAIMSGMLGLHLGL